MNLPRLSRIEAFLLMTAVLLFAPVSRAHQAKDAETINCAAYANLKAPKFRTAKKYRGDVKPGLFLFVSISPADYSYESVLTLVCSLAKEHASESHFSLRVFDDYSGAKRFNPQGEGNGAVEVKSFLVWYAFDREDKDQSLTWRPNRSDTNRWEKIALAELPTLSRQN